MAPRIEAGRLLVRRSMQGEHVGHDGQSCRPKPMPMTAMARSTILRKPKPIGLNGVLTGIHEQDFSGYWLEEKSPRNFNLLLGLARQEGYR